MENKIDIEKLHMSCECIGHNHVIFYYMGYFSQNIIAAMADSVKTRVEYIGAASPTRRKLFSSFIEMAQNIIHYSADSIATQGKTDAEMRRGSVCISVENDRYYLQCSNLVHADIADHLREKLEHLRTLTNDEIRLEYKETLRAETPQESKGAGLGLLTMARDASEPLDFEFIPEGADGNMMFCLKATI